MEDGTQVKDGRTAPAIAVEDLVRDHDGLKVVDGVSFQVGRGEVFGFLGPNGAGKTTVIPMMCTLLTTIVGVVLFRGME